MRSKFLSSLSPSLTSFLHYQCRNNTKRQPIFSSDLIKTGLSNRFLAVASEFEEKVSTKHASSITTHLNTDIQYRIRWYTNYIVRVVCGIKLVSLAKRKIITSFLTTSSTCLPPWIHSAFSYLFGWLKFTGWPFVVVSVGVTLGEPDESSQDHHSHCSHLIEAVGSYNQPTLSEICSLLFKKEDIHVC